MGGRDTAARNQQIFRALRDQGTEGYRIPASLREIIVGCAAPLRIVDVDIVVARRDGILKNSAGHKVLLRQHIFALYHAAFAHADFRAGIEQ